MGLGLTFFAAGSLVESEDATDPLSLLRTLEEEGVGPVMRVGSVADRRVLVEEVEAVGGMAGGAGSSSEISPEHMAKYNYLTHSAK